MSVAGRSVVIVQRRLTDYRIPLFELMRERLRSEGISLRLVVGDATPEELRKKDQGLLAWSTHVPCRYLFGGQICWQNFGPEARNVDLVVMTQENKLLYNLLALTIVRPRRIAFWGHGRNMQAKNANSLRERFKRWTTCTVDWWFAYNELSARLVRGQGFPVDRVTVLDNAIDTSALRRDLASVSETELREFRDTHGLIEGCTGIFIGSLYSEKRIAFLLEAADQIARRRPGFVLLIAGDGPDRRLVEEIAAPHIRYLGTVRGRDKAVLLRAADQVLNPGLVGLGILDAFSAGVPLITTNCHLHSPEIDYLVSGENGLMTDDSLDSFVTASVGLFDDEGVNSKLRDGASRAGDRYTIENMSDRFCEGIRNCLAGVPR